MKGSERFVEHFLRDAICFMMYDESLLDLKLSH